MTRSLTVQLKNETIHHSSQFSEKTKCYLLLRGVLPRTQLFRHAQDTRTPYAHTSIAF